jgi:hypothetical protein
MTDLTPKHRHRLKAKKMEVTCPGRALSSLYAESRPNQSLHQAPKSVALVNFVLRLELEAITCALSANSINLVS